MAKITRIRDKADWLLIVIVAVALLNTQVILLTESLRLQLIFKNSK